jgi:hypothetical protein
LLALFILCRHYWFEKFLRRYCTTGFTEIAPSGDTDTDRKLKILIKEQAYYRLTCD